MSDAPDSTPVDSAPAPDTAPVESAAPAETVESAAPASDSVLDTDLPEGMKSFDRSYVEKLRAEAASNRTKAREFEQSLREREEKLERFQAFDGYTDEDMQVWETMASSWKQGDDGAIKAAQMMQQIAQRVLGDPTATAEDKADAQEILDNPAVAETANEELTPDKVREIARAESAAEREEREREAAVQDIFNKIKDAGYEEGTVESVDVLWYARNVTDGDIDKAIQMQKDREQGIIDGYVKKMAEGGTPVQLADSGTAGSPAPQQPGDVKEARKMADAWLAERYAAEG